MHNGRCQVNVSHAFTADAAMRHFDAAAIADNPFELGTFVFTAGALPVTFRAEDTLTEQTVLFRSIGTIIDRLWFAYFAERPTAYVVGTGQTNLYGTIIIDPIVY